jgi:hypothetical protein
MITKIEYILEDNYENYKLLTIEIYVQHVSLW